MTASLCILAAWMLQTFCPPPSAETSRIPADAAPVYRLWSPVQERHFYTLDGAERDVLLTGDEETWVCDCAAFRVFPRRDNNDLAPVHRFWSGRLNSHFYTVDDREVNALLVNAPDVWTYEGIAFYAYPPGRGPSNTVPVHRFWSGALGTHFYTASDRERFAATCDSAGLWQYEGVAFHAYPSDDPCNVRIVKGPAVEWVTPTGATILWETDVPAGTRIVGGIEFAGLFEVADPALVTLHKVVLADLVPDAAYAYTVFSETACTTGSFTTAPPPDRAFRFAVCGDTQLDSQTCVQITQNILADRPRIVFHAGDLTAVGRDLDRWEAEFFGPARELLANTAVVPVPGNHEYFGSGPPWFFYFFDRSLSQGWFALTYGSVRFVGLNTSAPFSAGSPQQDWLLQEFACEAFHSAAWRVVIFHQPPFTATTGHADNMAVREQLVPLFERYGVDAVFSGHSHAYERYWRRGVCYIVTGGGGGSLYGLLADLEPPIRQFGLSVHHHCTVDVDPVGGTFTIAAVDLDGRIFDLVKLHRPASSMASAGRPNLAPPPRPVPTRP